MDYKKLYDSICNRAKEEVDLRKQRKKNGEYFEGHHIVPRCMGGKGDAKTWRHPNIVPLTGREHFLVHKILVEIYPENRGLLQAMWTMSITKKDRYNVSARDYERAKKINSKLTIERHSKPIDQYNMKGEYIRSFKSSTEASRILGIKENNIFASVRGGKFCSAGGFIFIKTGNSCEVSDRVERLRKAKKEIQVHQYSLTKEYIASYDNYNDACKATGIQKGSLCKCIKGERKTSGGFIWSPILL